MCSFYPERLQNKAELDENFRLILVRSMRRIVFLLGVCCMLAHAVSAQRTITDKSG